MSQKRVPMSRAKPFAPDRSLSTMLVHDQNPPCPPLEKERKDLILLSHHDGDVGHPPRDMNVANEAAEVAAKKAAWTERLYQGSAGAPIVREGSASIDPAAVSPENAAAVGGPRQAAPAGAQEERLARWKPRFTPKQVADAEEAKRTFAKQAQVYDQPKVGAKSADFAVEPTYFNILYTHPNFGAMPTWGATGTQSKAMPLLPPICSRAGLLVPPSERRAARVNWGNGKRAFPLTGLPESQLPVSPSMHCCVSKALPSMPKKEVSTSTNPWLRNPPRTAHAKQLYEAMYGPAPNDPKRRITSRDAAATRLQAGYRGHASRR
jgi:hypothetical protein